MNRPEMIEIPTVRSLRRGWKPHKERLQGPDGGHPTAIRFHRACSWIQRVEDHAEAADEDMDLVSLWVSFNALYGQWDQRGREPKPDRKSWREFVDALWKLDKDEQIAGLLVEHKKLVMSLLEDVYLSGYFWQEPTADRAKKSGKTKYSAQGWYVEKRWVMILDEVLDRVYLMRCQLVHGAASHNSSLNRQTLHRCVMMMRRLLPAFLQVWIDHGADKDWGTMCYPPLTTKQTG